MTRARRFLITGADGQLGRALVDLLPTAEPACDVVAFDRRSLDITDRHMVADLLARYRPDVVLHAAAYTKVDLAEVHRQDAWAVNGAGTANVAGAAAAVGATMVYPSTDYVFSGSGPIAYAENCPTAPLSVYGRSKLAGERAVTAQPGGLVVRTSWVYGDGHNFVRTIVGAAARYGEVSVVDDQIGRPTSAWDLAGGLLGLVRAGATGVFHLAGGGPPCTWADLAAEAIGAAGIRAAVRRISTEDFLARDAGPVAPRPVRSILDCSKAAAVGVRLRPWRVAVADHVRNRMQPPVAAAS